MKPTSGHPDEPAWLSIARSELAAGIREIPGIDANPRILEYFRATRLVPLQGDETSWCSAGACWCMELAGYKSPHSARARDWLSWGRALLDPLPGAVTVLSRGDNPGQGHVGFYVGQQTASRILLLGGNQQNSWSIGAYPRARVLGYRWPSEDHTRPAA